MAAQVHPVGLETERIGSYCCPHSADPGHELPAADFHAGKLVRFPAEPLIPGYGPTRLQSVISVLHP